MCFASGASTFVAVSERSEEIFCGNLACEEFLCEKPDPSGRINIFFCGLIPLRVLGNVTFEGDGLRTHEVHDVNGLGFA